MAQPLKVLIYDLETAPLLAHVWGPREDWIPHDRMLHDSFLLTWSAKWRGEKKMYTGVLTSKEAKKQDDTRIVQELSELIREADILIAHNGDRFDIPMFNNRLLLLNQEPMGPKKTIDTCTLAKKSFRLAYNKLDYLGEKLGLGRKIKTDFDLWRRCYMGDEKALAEMSKYNKQDVVLLEQVFDTMLPYVKGLPRMVEPGYFNEHVCTTCGSSNLQRRGVYRTNASTFQQYQCNDCKRYCRLRASEKDNRLTTAPL